jgi:hypothetical protein
MKVTSPTRRAPGTARIPERQNLWILDLCIWSTLLPDFRPRRHRYKSYAKHLVRQFLDFAKRVIQKMTRPRDERGSGTGTKTVETRCLVASHPVQKRLFRGCVIALLGIQPEGCWRCRPCEVNFEPMPFAVSTAIARVITKNVLIAQFVADLGHRA